MTAIGYMRVSTRGQSLETGEAMIYEYAKTHGITLSKMYADDGVSGVLSSREGLDAMLEDMRTGRFDTIIVTKLDRLGRSLINLLNLLLEFKNRKIRVISISDGVDTLNDTPMTRAFLNLLGTFAELEREIIADRTIGGIELKKKQIKENGFAITKKGKRITRLGRPEGSKDKKGVRSKSGYIKRYAGTTREQRKLGKRKVKNEIGCEVSYNVD